MQLGLSLLLGAAIGLERESYEHVTDRTPASGVGSLGIRSYALVSLLGSLAALFSYIHIGFFIVIALSFILILTAYYIIGSFTTKDHGVTTDLAILFCFIIGAMTGIAVIPLQITIAVTVTLILILSIKQQVKSFVRSIQSAELNGFIGYAIIALVILPFLPNVSITLSDIPQLATILSAYGITLGSLADLELINPFNVWRVVAIITGIEIAGYFMQKTLGQKKGWLLTSIAGGFISSTSTTQSLAQQSKKHKGVDRLVAAAVFSNVSSFVQMFILIAAINTTFLIESTPFIIALLIASVAVGLYFFIQKNPAGAENLEGTKEQLKSTSLFSLKPAIQFALLFMTVKIVTKMLLFTMGEGGFLIGNVFASVTGLDAVIFNNSDLAGGAISVQIATMTLALANGMNLAAKSAYSWMQGSREFATKFSIAVVCMIGGSLLGLIPLFF